ncbi:hypothetical protein [Lutibacter sp.]|uniref:hypothetical protein n=1 Tax=Lutibacter sp. TaxID=1925666 RepID=UPI00273266ED|nr:hypothetical protein [Lutibacter sp.]MDP3313579.1 hypothetical protein [Lutibacter sp.]
MLLLLATANIIANNTSVHIQYDFEKSNEMVITRLYDKPFEDNSLLNLSIHYRNQNVLTLAEINSDSNNNSSTWEEFTENNFDLISKFSAKKSFLLKSKIVSVRKFVPKIVIE